MSYNWHGPVVRAPVKVTEVGDYPALMNTIYIRDLSLVKVDDVIGAAIRCVLTENPGQVACSYDKCLRVVTAESPVIILQSRLYHESCYGLHYRALVAKDVRRPRR